MIQDQCEQVLNRSQAAVDEQDPYIKAISLAAVIHAAEGGLATLEKQFGIVLNGG